MAKSTHTLHKGVPVWLVLLGVIGLAVLVAALLRGSDVALFHPAGQIADQQHRLMMLALAIMLVIAVPTLTALYFFAWHYQEGRSQAAASHRPGSKLSVAIFWALPAATVFVLVSLMLPATQKLTPQKSITSTNQPLTIQVVALRWKWLFIYPTQNIATVNYLQIPVATPVQFDLTADEAPMNSFWIPRLGGQLYAMTGHENRLNLMADYTGDYTGSAAEINGAGFAGMRFTTHVSSASDFTQWVQRLKLSGDLLDTAAYTALLAPSQNNPAAAYSGVQADLYDTILAKYAGSHHHAGY